MDKTWTTLDSKNKMARLGQEYQRGVKSFIDFAKANAGDATQIHCPCRVCLNSRRYDFATVKFHIIHKGMQASYTTWIYHGETTPPVNEVVEPGHEDIDSDYEDRDEYPEMMHDHYMGTYAEAETIDGNAICHFERILDASQCPLYPGYSPDNTLQDFVVQRLELGLSQPEVSGSPVAQQQLIKGVLGKRVARRQGYRSRGPASIPSSTVAATKVSSLRQQLAELQIAQEELRRQCEEVQKGQEDLRRQQEVMQDQAATQASQIQMLLQRAGLGGSGSTGS